MENKIVKEFRNNVENFKSEYVVKGLSYIGRLCQVYGRFMHEIEPLRLPMTTILRFDFGGYKRDKWFNGPTSYGIWSLQLYINEEKFEELEDNKKIVFVSELIVEYLCRLFDLQKLDKQRIYDAAAKIKANDYYIKIEEFKNRNRKTICWYEVLNGYGENKYRLCYQNNGDEVKRISICTKKHYDPILWKKLNVHDMLTIPQVFTNKRWRNTNEFVMVWGKEEYVFYLDKEKIVLNILE
jgi:hypothetical protein